MKTVSEFAKEKGVAPVTIYRKINKCVKQDVIQCITEKKGNITYITDEGEVILSEFFPSVIHGNTDVKQVLHSVVHDEIAINDEIMFLREQLKKAQEQSEKLQDELNKEREHSRTEISKLNSELIAINKNQQLLLAREQEKTLLIESTDSKKKSWFKRFKKGESND